MNFDAISSVMKPTNAFEAFSFFKTERGIHHVQHEVFFVCFLEKTSWPNFVIARTCTVLYNIYNKTERYIVNVRESSYNGHEI